MGCYDDFTLRRQNFVQLDERVSIVKESCLLKSILNYSVPQSFVDFYTIPI